LDDAGGIPGVMKAMGALLDQNVMTVTGHNLAENLKEADIFSSDIIRPLTHPVHPYGGIAILKGNLAPRGAVIKQVALKESLWTFSGPARVFDSEEDALAGLGSGKVKAGEVVVIRYEGPIGGPGMREMALVRVFLTLLGLGEATFLITDGRFSGYSEGPCIGYLAPEAAEGGPIALLKDDDMIHIDIASRKLTVDIDDAELERRQGAWQRPQKTLPHGYLNLYQRIVSPADEGAIIR